MADSTTIRQKQIPLAWNGIGRENSEGKPSTVGNWHPDTPKFRETLRVVMEAGIDSFGRGSHWIE